MKFPYSSIISAAAGEGDFFVLRRPEVPVTISGPGGSMTLIGLVDTGSDNTIFPRSVADYLQIPLRSEEGPSASAFGGQRIDLLTGDVVLSLEAEDGDGCAWPASVCFFEFASTEEESVILGHAGFLDFFTATFDGKEAALTLIANDLPTVT